MANHYDRNDDHQVFETLEPGDIDQHGRRYAYEAEFNAQELAAINKFDEWFERREAREQKGVIWQKRSKTAPF